MNYMKWQVALFIAISLAVCPKAAKAGATLADKQTALRVAGDEMLENLDVSYVYGGSKVSDPGTCSLCNGCLESERPGPKERLTKCPTCANCSLDCSHFTQMVYGRAGLAYSYLTTAQMLSLSAPDLERRFGLVSVGSSGRYAIPGDLLVYHGHVVIVEAVHDPTTADVIHATGGRDLKGPGQGIQRERFVKMDSFRGELRRVLRHKRVETLRVAKSRTERPVNASPGAGPDLSRLRPVEKRR